MRKGKEPHGPELVVRGSKMTVRCSECDSIGKYWEDEVLICLGEPAEPAERRIYRLCVETGREQVRIGLTPEMVTALCYTLMQEIFRQFDSVMSYLAGLESKLK
ncbi:TPA: hypothetical protein EYP37_09310 [Candidatus Poribacteria bacterium]|nr:hypothetical protein [Candidatus Poribacteria bacterium]